MEEGVVGGDGAGTVAGGGDLLRRLALGLALARDDGRGGGLEDGAGSAESERLGGPEVEDVAQAGRRLAQFGGEFLGAADLFGRAVGDGG